MSAPNQFAASTASSVRRVDALPIGACDEVSRALGWSAGFLFSARTVFVFVSARWLSAGTGPGVAASYLASTFLVALSLMQAAGPSAGSLRWVWNVKPFRWLAGYLALSGCSLLWTQAASPASSTVYWCGLAADVALMLLVRRGASTPDPIYSVLKGFICGSCVLAAIAWLIPPEQDLRLGDLDYFNTNQIGNLCALSIFLCLILVMRDRGNWRPACAFLLVTLLRSLSKSTLVAFIASQIYRLLLDRGMERSKKILLGVCAAGLVLAFWGLIEAYAGIYTTEGNQAETLTGRTAIWAWSFDAALSRPWFGNGIDGMWKVAPSFGGELFEARHAENEILQQFFAYGAAGLVALLGLYGSLWRWIRTACMGAERRILNSLMIYILVRGLAEAEPFDLLLPLWLISAIVLLTRRVAPEESPSPLPSSVGAEPCGELKS